MKVMITGSSGFIGGWVARLLRLEGHTVIGIDVRPPRFATDVDHHFECNILNGPCLKELFEETTPDAVVHLAARVDLEETKDLSGYAANIEGVKNLIDAVRATPSVGRAIYTSSQLVCRVGYVPKTEDDYCASTLYGESKIWTERIVRSEDGGGAVWCLCRPTTVWGPYMSAHYQTLLKLIRKRLYFHLGKRSLLKSYSYAGNIAHQYYKLLLAPAESLHRRTFYLCDYQPLSLREYADELAVQLHAPKIPSLPLPLAWFLAYCGDALNSTRLARSPFTSFRLNNILTEYIFDTSATQAVCGVLPYGLAEGIKQTASWYLESSAEARTPE